MPIKITSKKLRGKNVDFSTHQITRMKIRGNNVVYSTIKITSKKLGGNKVVLLTREITLKKVCGNNMNFSTSEITSKKSIWKQRGFFDQLNLILDLLTRYQCWINVDSTCCARWDIGSNVLEVIRQLFFLHLMFEFYL